MGPQERDAPLMADMQAHQRKLRENRQRLMSKLTTGRQSAEEVKPTENELRREELAKQIRVDGRETTEAHLDAICELVRVTMPGAVRTAFTGELRALQSQLRDGGRRDSFTRGVWAGWSSLLTQLIVRIEKEPEPPIANLDALSKEPPSFA